MTVEVDTSAFNAMCDELARVCDQPPEAIIREEVGKVLERAIELTPAASTDKIKERAANAPFTLQPATLYTPKRPGRRHPVNGRILYQLQGHRYPNALWTKILAERAKDIKKRKAARGLAKQSWWKLAQILGLSTKAPNYVQQAVATTGRTYPDDGKAKTIRGKAQIGYEIENSQPTITAIGGDVILQQAIDGRVSYFLKNVEHDVFSKLEDVAKKYPGVTVS